MIKTGKSHPCPTALANLPRFFLWVLMLVVLATETAWPAEVQVTASVDRQELTLEDSVNFSIIVEGTQSAPPPQLPQLDSFSVRVRGSSSSFQIINGRKSSSITYNYTLLPSKTGTFTIGPAVVTIEGKRYQTAPITLIIKQPSEITGTTRDVFAEWIVSNLEPFVQEQVTATLRIYHRVEIKNLRADFQFNGFREEALKGPTQNTRMVNGIRYLSSEISTALFPLRSGKVEIPATFIEFDQVDRTRHGNTFDPFGQGSIFGNFGRLEHKTLRTQAITLDVQPLPQKNRPGNFSNLVGDFIISAQLSRTELEVGDTTTLTVSVFGQGNVKDLSLPPPQWGDDIKVYEDQSEYRQTTSALKVTGEKLYTFALVPRHPGKLQVPAVQLNYFDPTKAEYVSIATQSLPLTVSPAKGGSKLNVVESNANTSGNTGDSIRKIGEDILQIHTGPEIFEKPNAFTRSGILYGLGLVLPAGLFFIYRGIYKRRLRLKNDIAFSRRQGAYKLAHKKLKSLTQDREPRETARELSLILREYLGNILNLQGTAITSTEVEEKLIRGNFSAEEIQATRGLLEKHETLHYASVPEIPQEELIRETRMLLDRLERKP